MSWSENYKLSKVNLEKTSLHFTRPINVIGWAKTFSDTLAASEGTDLSERIFVFSESGLRGSVGDCSCGTRESLKKLFKGWGLPSTLPKTNQKVALVRICKNHIVREEVSQVVATIGHEICHAYCSLLGRRQGKDGHSEEWLRLMEEVLGLPGETTCCVKGSMKTVQLFCHKCNKEYSVSAKKMNYWKARNGWMQCCFCGERLFETKPKEVSHA